MLRGEDSLAALDPAARARLAGLIGEEGWAEGIGFDIRFHLHPEVAPQMQGDGLRLALPGGDWLFSHDGTGGMRLEPSAWLDPAQGVAVPSRQIVLTGGGSLVPGIDGLAARILGHRVRLGRVGCSRASR